MFLHCPQAHDESAPGPEDLHVLCEGRMPLREKLTQ